MKMIFLKFFFLICTFQDPNMADNLKNSAENLLRNGTPRSSGSSFFPSLKEGYSQNLGPDLGNVRITLMDSTHKKLIEAMHQQGPGCRCTECGKLKCY